MKMKHTYLFGVIAGTVFLTAPAFAGETIEETLKESVVKVKLRMRYENVAWDGLEDSDGVTLLSRLSYQTGTYKGFAVTAEFDDVTAIGDVDYRTAANDPNNPGTAIIADPEGTEVNQSFLSYTNHETQVRYGRQRILLDNQRFVGGVGWRQNEQTYDGFSVDSKVLPETEVFYAYVTNVNRVFGEDNPIGDQKQETHLVNIGYSGFGAGKLTAYAYLIDNITAPTLASDTYGVRWMGKISDAFAYNLEYATQSDGGENPTTYSADYILLEGVANLGQFNTKLGYELLGSDDGTVGFATPLATLHAFQGWADRFLDTPAKGIKDIYLAVGTSVSDVQLQVVYHQLASDADNLDYGNEVDAVASKKFGMVTYTAKVADYQSDEFGSDTTKFWLMAEMNF